MKDICIYLFANSFLHRKENLFQCLLICEADDVHKQEAELLYWDNCVIFRTIYGLSLSNFQHQLTLTLVDVFSRIDLHNLLVESIISSSVITEISKFIN